ncbi:hypothetical protein ACH5Y9_08225 [Methylomonas sp. BW4-1]|uniref:hypothetical protein n=1 Tax=Methylomonas sp. BW4-1 TaxID=3376685 RepID=UPI004043863D
MDSMIVFFGRTTSEMVEQEASLLGFVAGTVSKSSEQFYLWRYVEESLHADFEPNELKAIRAALGGEIKSAFQVASRHGQDARFAIQVVSSLMSSLGPSLLDNDSGTLWKPEEVAACAKSNPEKGLYALRTEA